MQSSSSRPRLGVCRPKVVKRLPAYRVEAVEIRRLLAANVLVFTAIPTTSAAGSVIDQVSGIQVTVENSAGQTITSNTDTITLSIGANLGGATLAGTASASAANGVATFSTVSIAQPSKGYTLVASDTTSSSVVPATSPAFNINAIPVFNSLLSFSTADRGTEPEGGLIADRYGNLYGTTANSSSGYGSVFELSGTGHTIFTTLISFSGTSGDYLGANPANALVIDPSGNLYGTTLNGGIYGYGTVFELSGASHTNFISLISFTNNHNPVLGALPEGITMDSSGNIYGAALSGGIYGYGDVFELSGSNHTTFTHLISFTNNSGSFLGENPTGISSEQQLAVESTDMVRFLKLPVRPTQLLNH